MAIELKDIAKYLTKTEEDPLKVRIDDDGSLVVIAHNGMKFRFSGLQIAQAEKVLKLPPTHKPSGKPTAKSVAKPASPKKDDVKPKPASKTQNKT